MARLWQAQMIAGSSPLNEMGQYLSLLPEFFMALPFDITNNHAVYTWLQAGFFLWTVLEFARCFFCGWKRWLVWILLMTCPLIIGYSVFWEMSVVCLACILWLLILEEELDRRQCSMSRPAKIVFWCVYAGLVFVMTGYRLNAGTVAVGLLGLGAWKTLRRGYPKEQLICRAVAVIAAVLSAFFLPAMLGVQGHNNAGFGIVWEIRCTLAEIGEGNGVDTYLDDLLGEGRTREILAEESDQLLSGYGFTMGEVMSAVANKNEDIYRKYFGIILKYPKEWLITKAKFIICNMQTLPEVTYWYNGGEGTDYDLTAYGMMPTNRRTLFHRIVTQYIIWAAWLRTPWFMFLIAALLAAARRFLAGGPCADAKLIFFAFCHEFAFFVTSQSFEYRYFFPSSILLALACLLSLLELLPALWRRLRRHSRPNSNQRSAA